MGWFARPVFDELLDPDTVEEVVDGNGTINAKNPVTLECEIAGTLTAIAYDGWYDPSGNRDSDPPGPSIFVTPTSGFAAPTSGRCQISVNDTVKDKDGTAPPTDSMAPHEFFIEPLVLASTSPGDCEDGVDVAAQLGVTFNAPLDEATLTAASFALEDAAGVPVVFTISMIPDDPDTEDVDESDPFTAVITPVALLPDTVYTLTVTSQGDAKIADALGGEAELEPTVITFSTTEVAAGEDPVACPE
jgi:hypothetical protein